MEPQFHSTNFTVDNTTYATIDTMCTEYTNGPSMINGTTTTCTILMTSRQLLGFTVSDLGTFIKVRVRASNTYGNSDYSSTNVDSALVQSAPTLDVSTVTLAKTMNSITATWTTSPSTQVGYGYANYH